MTQALELRGVTKRFGKKVALDDVSLSVPERSIIGLVGRNGSGKTTLLRHVTGLYLPTSGECVTLGCPSRDLGPKELSQIGMVNQHDTFIEWMKVEQFLRYISSFYPVWDRELEAQLVSSLEIDVNARVGTLSPGNAQKIGLVVATCHHPTLLLLDEPLSDLDPIVRARAVSMLLERFSDDRLTMIVSSHMLHDIERIVDRVVCLEAGRIVADASLDDLKEEYAEWIVSSPAGTLPTKFDESYVLKSEGDRFDARLEVRHSDAALAAFALLHGAAVEVRPLNLEKIFPLLVGTAQNRASKSDRAVSNPVGARSR
jgi:ABC-2 type transport system ATP-binding protein